MAESCAPWNFSGGNVMGTRSTVLQTSCSPRMVQLGFDLRKSRSSGLRSGMRYLPIFRKRSTSPMWAEDSTGR